MAHHTKNAFDATASEYDKDRFRLIPGYESFYRWAVDLIPSDSMHILDLGAGSGLMTELVNRRFPKASIHLIDVSGPMLDLARRRFGNNSRITYEQADYLEASFPKRLDAIISSLSIHHLPDKQKKKIFRKIYKALATGGVFVNAEQVAGPTKNLSRRYKDIWLLQIKKAGATEKQIKQALFRMREDRCSPIEDQLKWMRNAGFSDADCWFKEGRFAVLAAVR
jgi:tRNA (cmo5U34)-methyltransferase